MDKQRGMAPYHKVKIVDVYIWGRIAGQIILDPILNFFSFTYSDSFLKRHISLSPISMPIDTSDKSFVFTNLPESTFFRLPAMIADSLSENLDDSALIEFLNDFDITIGDISPLDRLVHAGSKSLGALEFKNRSDLLSARPSILNFGKYSLNLRGAILGTFSNDNQIYKTLSNLIAIGHLAGGSRAKTLIALNKKTCEVRSGQVKTPRNFEQWILKFDGLNLDQHLAASQDFGRIEFVYYQMARDAGIDISDSRLLNENGRAHFMTKRFNRGKNNIKYHVQTLCAMNHVNFKDTGINSYEKLFVTAQMLHLEHPAFVELFRRMVFNILANNCDDHAKNIAFLLKEGGLWELAPAYDITFAYNPDGKWTHQHQMSINGKFGGISRGDLETIANSFEISEARDIIEAVQTSIRKWSSLSRVSGITPSEVRRIRKTFPVLLH